MNHQMFFSADSKEVAKFNPTGARDIFFEYIAITLDCFGLSRNGFRKT